jgi:hypothetical protein
MTSYFIDTEFADTGTIIELISIGIVSSDRRTYYAQDATYDLSSASQWLRENVIPHLDKQAWKSREQIQRDLINFMDVEKYGKPEFVGWCAGYDWVVLCQLFGTMMDLPTGWSHYIKDIQYLLDELSISDDELPMPEEGNVHNALDDAKHIQLLWNYVQQRKALAEEKKN